MAATSKSRVIEVPEVKLGSLTVTIKGETPLITNRFGDAALKQMENAQQGAAKMKKQPRKPEDEFRDKLYVIDAEHHIYGFPAAGVKKALVSAGGRFADEQMTVLRGAVSILGDILAIETDGAEPVMRSDPVRLAGPGRVASVAYRPGFWPWRIRVPVVFNTSVIGEAQVVNLFNIAGFSVGIGDWRPERSGTFGQFQVQSVEEGIHTPEHDQSTAVKAA